MTTFIVTRTIDPHVEALPADDLVINDEFEAVDAEECLMKFLHKFPHIRVRNIQPDGPRHLWADFEGSFTDGEIHVHPGRIS